MPGGAVRRRREARAAEPGRRGVGVRGDGVQADGDAPAGAERGRRGPLTQHLRPAPARTSTTLLRVSRKGETFNLVSSCRVARVLWFSLLLHTLFLSFASL